MSHPHLTLSIDEVTLGRSLACMSDEDLDELDFGVIGFDAAGIVRRYNRHETEAAGLSPARVLGRPMFTEVAPCMNNFIVAQRFEDSQRAREPLDIFVPYVLTLRMKPIKVILRLLASADGSQAWILVQRAPRT